MHVKNHILCLFLIFAHSLFGQNKKTITVDLGKPTEAFTDVQHGIATDSFSHNMGRVAQQNIFFIKRFQYMGDTSTRIIHAFTGDPYFIYKYPKEPLEKGKMYEFEVAFFFEGKQGPFSKHMGFVLADGTWIHFIFSGYILEN